MSKTGQRVTTGRRRNARWGICLLLPLLMGGCPEFQNATVSAIDAATRGVLFADATGEEAAATASVGILNAALDLFFEQFMTD